MSPFIALRRVQRIKPGRMLDIGARDCRIARQFADNGYTVDALEPTPLPAAHENAAAAPGLTLHEKTLEAFETEARYDLVVASLVSQFVRYSLPEYLARLRGLIAADGVFYTTLIGDEDDWAGKPIVKAVSEDRALALFEAAGLTVLHRSSERFNGPTYDGTLKNWHILSFVAAGAT